MTAQIVTVECKFCSLAQVASQPHCAGCGAGLPLKYGELESTRKLLAMATQMNALLVKEHTRAGAESRAKKIVLGISFACIAYLMWALGLNQWFSPAQVYTEEQMMQRNAANAGYTQALEMQLFEERGGMAPLEPLAEQHEP